MATPARKSRGRQKIALERMQKESNRLVTFSKRRGGVLKKASELCTLCGAHALCIVFSPANKVFAFGHPSVEAIINRFLLEDNDFPQDNRVFTKPFQSGTLLRSNMEVSLLKDQMDMERKRGVEILKERKLKSEEAQKYLAPAETLTLSELKQIQATLIALRNNVYTHRKNLIEAQSLLSNPNPTHLILDDHPTNTLISQNYNPNFNLVQSHPPPTIGDPLSQMTIVRDPNDTPMTMIPTPMSAFNGSKLAIRSNLMNPGFNNPNILPSFQGPSNPLPGSFDGQMGWNNTTGKTFTNLLTGEGSSNSPILPFNSQGGYMGSNPIPGDYLISPNVVGDDNSNSRALPLNLSGNYMGNNPIPSDYPIFTNLIGDYSSNSSAPPFISQGRYMGSDPIPGDYQTYQNLIMGDGSLNPFIPPTNPQGGFDFGSGFDHGMN